MLPAECRVRLLGDREDSLTHYWAQVDFENDPRFRGHPVQPIDDVAEWVIPVRLHGDGVPITKTDSM